MRYSEFGQILNEVFIDPNEDEIFKQHAGDIRKPTLTLRMLNKLKKIRATNDLEGIKKESLLGVMYGIPEDDDGGF